MTLLCAITLGSGACDGTDKGEDALDRGRLYLEQNLPQMADAEFNRALAAEPGSVEASFGLALSRVQGIFHLMDWVTTLVGQNGTFPQAAPSRSAPVQDENEFIYRLLTDFLGRILALTREANEGFLRASAAPGFEFEVRSVPLTIRERTVLDLGGRYTPTDARVLAAAGEAFEATMYILLSQDLKTDYFGAFAHAKPLVLTGGLDPGNLTGGAGTATLMNVLAFTLHHPQYPGFLAASAADLDGNGVPDGTEFLGRARTTLEKATSEFAASVETLSASADATSACRFASASGGGKVECGGAGHALAIPVTTSFRTALSRMAAHLRGDEPKVLSMKKDLSPALAVVVAAVTQSGLLDIPELAAFGKETNIIEAAVAALLPVDIGLDLYTHLGTPHGIRGLFPAVRLDLAPDEINFLFEWECPGVIDQKAALGSTSAYPKGGLTCPADAQLADGAHFSDSLFGSYGIPAIAADGLASAFPSIPFPDPTLVGLLYIERDGSLQQATQQSLNDFVISLGTLLAPLLD